jgi:hypothetical protein
MSIDSFFHDKLSNKNFQYISGILNNSGYDVYIYNESLIRNNNSDVTIFCTSNDTNILDLNIIQKIFVDDNNTISVNITNKCLVIKMINQNPQKSNNTTIYLNIFGMSTKHDVYFTNTNLKINIFTGKISLINHLEEIKSECIDKLVPPVKNDNDLLNVCINDLKNSSAQFLMSTKTDKILKKTFFNKYEYKKRVKYFINTVFNNILSNNKKKKIFDIIDYDFKKSYSISLKTLVTKPQKIETDDDCLICLEKLNSKSCFKLPCCHKYIHKNCLFSCEEYDCRCPNCRQNWYNT